jgi:hypothetical protein
MLSPNRRLILALALAGSLTGLTPAANARQALVENARLEAGRWSIRNNTGVAVAVYLGTSGDLPRPQIEESIRRGFGRHGVTNVVFFYEQNDVPRTGFSLHENGNAYGPLVATELKDAIGTVAAQVNLVREHPELGERYRRK